MGFLIAFLFLAYVSIMLYLLINCGKIGIGVGFMMLVFLFGGIIQVGMNQSEKGPCVQYETQMHYNVATKTMMPARVCVLRGEWVDEDK